MEENTHDSRKKPTNQPHTGLLFQLSATCAGILLEVSFSGLGSNSDTFSKILSPISIGIPVGYTVRIPPCVQIFGDHFFNCDGPTGGWKGEKWRGRWRGGKPEKDCLQEVRLHHPESPKRETDLQGRKKWQHLLAATFVSTIKFPFVLQVQLPVTSKEAQDVSATEVLARHLCVNDIYTFENMGFSNTVEDMKYLVCADCEFGPIGYMSLTDKKSFVSLDRVDERDE